MVETHVCETPEDTFRLGEGIGERLAAGDVVLLNGGLGAGKTLLTKGVMSALGFDVAEVTSPSFALVNLYKTDKFEVYHVDLWRLDEGSDVAGAIGLDEILSTENAITIIEWAEKLRAFSHPGRIVEITIEGDGDDPRKIIIRSPEP